MTSKWIGDAIGTDGIYSVWIAMRKYPWLPPIDYHDKGETAADIMKYFEELVVVNNANCTMLDLGEFLVPLVSTMATNSMQDEHVKHHDFHGFPVVDGRKLLGYVTRSGLKMAIGIPYGPFEESIVWLIRANRCILFR